MLPQNQAIPVFHLITIVDCVFIHHVAYMMLIDLCVKPLASQDNGNNWWH